MRRGGRLIRHEQLPSHDGMDTTVIGIAARGKAWYGEMSARWNRAGVKEAGAVILHTIAVCHGMVGGGWILPTDGCAAGHGCSGGYVIGRSVFHEDLGGLGEVQRWSAHCCEDDGYQG